MGTTALRQLLRSICNNSQWNYAVLWKLRYQSELILTWEDGYFDYPKPRGPEESMSDDICCSSATEIIPLHFETSIHNVSSEGYPIGQVVANMSHLQYTLGEGIVGEVAFMGNHCWVFYDGAFAADVNPKLIHEYPSEWLLQFASGIKTIVLVPVLPHGVLQLGSLEMVAEDLAVVAYIKNRFDLHNAYAADSVKLNKTMMPTSDQVMSLLHVQDVLQVSGKDHPEVCGSASEEKICVLPVSLSEVSTPPGHSINDSQLEMVESKFLELTCMEEELQAHSQCNKYDLGVFGGFSNANVNADPTGDLVKQMLRDKNENDTGHKSVSPFLSFPEGCELHKALGPAFQRQTREYLWKSSFSVEENCSNLIFIKNRNLVDGSEPLWSANLIFIKNRNLVDGSEPLCSAKEGDAEHLLESVVSNVYSSSDNNSSGYKSSRTFSEQFAASSQPQSQSEVKASVGHDSVLWSHVMSESVSLARSDFNTSASFKSIMSAAIDKDRLEKGYNNMQPRKGQKPSINKRRASAGDNQRPRPRDRQMIQDRFKELRELVPNGAKCSIDGLLDRTIKHMLYLRSVTDQAAKLKQWAHQEVTDRNNLMSSEVKRGGHNGISWAFELGNELQPCPIVVEDLAHPGHMLLEMLCNEPSLFLEIAQVIRGLELTILKGVMESRVNETWAHFIVEVTKGFLRLDIFWPLMQLLQRKRNTISSKI